MRPKYSAKQLLKLYEAHGQPAVDKFLKDAVNDGKVTIRDYSLRDLAETFLGESWNQPFKRLALAEAGAPVTSSQFSNITGQLMFSEIRRQFEHEGFHFSQRIPVIQSRIDGTETVPSIAPMGDESQVVLEGQEYPSVGISEEYFTVPAKSKRGFKIEVTEEMIFFDKTGLVEEQARQVGYMLGLKREKDLIDVFSGQNNNYIRNGTATNTYLTAGAYVNNQSSTELVDWTDVEQAEQLLREILHPTTGEPLQPPAPGDMTLVVMPRKKHTARQILGATQLRSTAGTNTEFLSGNTVDPYQLLADSELLYQRVLATIEPTAAVAQDVWWLGDLSRAFAWYENWPLSVERMAEGSPAMFERDVALAFRARYRGVAAVREPRYIVRMEGTAV